MHVRKSRDDGVTRMFLRHICFSYESREREVTRLHVNCNSRGSMIPRACSEVPRSLLKARQKLRKGQLS